MHKNKIDIKKLKLKKKRKKKKREDERWSWERSIWNVLKNVDNISDFQLEFNPPQYFPQSF